MDIQPAIRIMPGEEVEDAMHPALPSQPFWDISLGKRLMYAQTGCNLCKKSMGKKHCKMDIGRENNAAPAKKAPKKEQGKIGDGRGGMHFLSKLEH